MTDENNLKDVRAFIYSDSLEDYLNEIDKLFLPINSLEITGMGSQEIKHSNILAMLRFHVVMPARHNDLESRGIETA